MEGDHAAKCAAPLWRTIPHDRRTATLNRLRHGEQSVAAWWGAISRETATEMLRLFAETLVLVVERLSLGEHSATKLRRPERRDWNAVLHAAAGPRLKKRKSTSWPMAARDPVARRADEL